MWSLVAIRTVSSVKYPAPGQCALPLDVSSHFPQITGTSLRFSARIRDIDSANVTVPIFVSPCHLLYLGHEAEKERTSNHCYVPIAASPRQHSILSLSSTVLWALIFCPFLDAERFITCPILKAWNEGWNGWTAPSAAELSERWHHIAQANVMRALTKHRQHLVLQLT